MPSIIALAAGVVAFFAAALVIPAAVAAADGDWHELEAFVVVGVAYGFASALALMALRPRMRALSRSQIFIGASGAWLALVVAAAPLFILVEHSHPVEAFFEASFAAVTLGNSLTPAGEISAAMGLYRGMVAWQGGLLTLLLAVYVLGQYEVGGTSNRHLRLVLHSVQRGDPRLLATFVEVFIPYSAATLACATLLVLAQVQPLDAFGVAINVVSTNGYLPVQTGASALNNTLGEIIMLVFMLYGATGILWHRALAGRRWRQAIEHRESTLFLLFVLVVASVAGVSGFLGDTAGFDPARAAFNRMFDTISIMTTTGITHDPRFAIGLPFELVMALALLGGCAYSTAGGIKMFRIASMLHHTANEMRRLIYPSAVLAHSVDSPDQFRSAGAVWSAFYLTLLLIVVATLLFALQGLDLAASLGMAVGSYSSTGSVVTASLQSAAPADAASWGVLGTMSAVALIARVELLVVLAAVVRGNW